MGVDHPLSPAGCTFALLDANVLLPPRLSDILFDLAGQGLYLPRWTKAVEDEFMAHWAEVAIGGPISRRKAIRETSQGAADDARATHRLECFRQAVGVEHQVLGYDEIDVRRRVPNGVNKNDVHLIAAALTLRDRLDEFEPGNSHKLFVVSHNVRHLAPIDARKLGIEVAKPGIFIDALFASAPERVERSLQKTISDLASPPYTPGQLLGALRLHEAGATVEHFSRAWGVALPDENLGPAP